MAAIDDLIRQIGDPALRARIAEEVGRLSKQKKFGLVFEEHLPEVTPLYEVPVKRGALAARPTEMERLFVVAEVAGDIATCVEKGTKAKEEIPVSELVTVASFGDPIYPYLEALDSVENAPSSALWHTLIEADNYHALQLLDYLYHNKVDCIYIDPPYNTGAKDWKYNNDYVDGSDQYRHSKWLSMMQKRLRLAKKLLNPKDSVLIVTIDEKEYLHLGCLLEEMFPEARIQMISDVINRKGVARDKEFSKVEEYIFFVKQGAAGPALSEKNMLDEEKNNKKLTGTIWLSLQRFGSNSLRIDRPNMCYPIFVDEENEKIVDVGYAPDIDVKIGDVKFNNSYTAVWPMTLGKEGRWQLGRDSVIEGLKKGVIKLGSKQKDGHWSIQYLNAGAIKELNEGTLVSKGKDKNGALIVERVSSKLTAAKSVWYQSSHDASANGSGFLLKVFGDKKFSFPKSIYSTKDAIRFFVSNKPNALILDFFAGSGTTLHAVNLLNAEDGGSRRCILVTNNEVSVDEAKMLTKGGYKPGDDEWERLGIARYVTWPRTVCSIEGHDVNDAPLKGNYLGSDRPMADGFAANAAFFHLGFLDKNAVARGTQLEKLLSMLWLKAGAIGKCPEAKADDKMMVFPENRFAVLVNSQYAEEFRQELSGKQIDVAYIITDYENEYKSVADSLHVPKTYQLYRDYLDNFTINIGRD